MFVNNEIGVIQDIAAIGAVCREKVSSFHVDAAQATGKLPFDLALPVDLMSLASHKTYGPKGHWRPVRASQAARSPRSPNARGGMSAACVRARCPPPDRGHGWGVPHRPRGNGWERGRAPASACWIRLTDLEQVFINGDLARVPHNLNISFNYVRGRIAHHGDQGLAVSSALPALRPAWNPATCCAWGAATSCPQQPRRRGR